jgi:hypothetical protein
MESATQLLQKQPTLKAIRRHRAQSQMRSEQHSPCFAPDLLKLQTTKVFCLNDCPPSQTTLVSVAKPESLTHPMQCIRVCSFSLTSNSETISGRRCSSTTIPVHRHESRLFRWSRWSFSFRSSHLSPHDLSSPSPYL